MMVCEEEPRIPLLSQRPGECEYWVDFSWMENSKQQKKEAKE